MSTLQTSVFLAILVLVTVRTLIFRRVAVSTAPAATALGVGSGTVLVCLIFLPFAWRANVADLGMLHNLAGIGAGLVKGALLTALLVAQQQLIGRSLSATTYVFPVALGAIAVLDVIMFGSTISVRGMFAISVLFLSGVGFMIFGHLGAMSFGDKKRFSFMIAAVVGFACCDKIGIPASGWYIYLLYTGLGNFLSAAVLMRHRVHVGVSTWLIIALCWAIPELFFSFALSDILPVSYGYLAISLRVPLLMLVASFVFKEGQAAGQLAFGVLSLVGTIPLLFK